MSTASEEPRVSIGMPVFNGELSIENALDSLLGQTFLDFELIISDNFSSDGTQEICEKYAKNDKRINYFRQVENIGATANFKYVLEQASGEYFMWAAADDIRSPDFVEFNYSFLSDNNGYVASTSPNKLEGDMSFAEFSLEGSTYQRFISFFNNCWVSHGIFYSLMRTDVIKQCEIIGNSFIAADWAIDLYLASQGRVNRTTNGYMISGVNGISNSANAYKAFRNKIIEIFFPFYMLTKYTLKLSSSFSYKEKIKLSIILLKLNIKAALYPLRGAIIKIHQFIFTSKVNQKTEG